MKKEILILPAHIIEQDKWDQCIAKHANGLIYSRYDYLSNICDNWHGIVIGDYEAVMPLPWRKKYGLRYFYTPPFIQQLGLTGNTEKIDLELLTREIRQFAWYGDLMLNFSNSGLAEAVKAKQKINFIITLKNGYDKIHEAYSHDLKQTLQKKHPGLIYTSENDFLAAITAYQQNYASRMPHIHTDCFSRFTLLCRQLSQEGNCLVRSVRNEKGDILSNVLLLKDNKRIYHLINTTITEGRQMHSNHLLLDQLLRELSGRDLLFDFEGSELEGVRTFYKKFGGYSQPYFHYTRNILKGY